MIRTARATAPSRRRALGYLGAGLAVIGIGTAAFAGGFAEPAHAARSADAVKDAEPAVIHKHPAHHRTAHHRPAAETWGQVRTVLAHQTFPKPGGGSQLPARDRLTPVGTSGPQSFIPISSAQYHDAKVIVRQALQKHMGLRSAVIAVATAMQESKLVNINYGTSDSLGLFQQRPSTGWGTPAQIMRPSYAADAFLKALRGYESNNPAWANQPLYQAAQGVQGSAFPSAYAQWESQASHLVKMIATRLV